MKTESDYYEYRETYLKVGATTITIGAGEGEGSQRIKLNTGSVQTTLIVVDSGQSANALPAILWKGTHASNVVRVSKGSFGAALHAGETATIATLAVGYRDDQEADAQVYCGAGVTLTDVDVSGGTSRSTHHDDDRSDSRAADHHAAHTPRSTSTAVE